ncbi:hypothetical protein [Rhodanobacter sp. BL-MT-08]
MAFLDIIGDILRHVENRVGSIAPDALVDIERAARADWGGTRPYVAKIGDSDRVALMQRDEAICSDAKNGVPEDYLSLKYDLCLRRIRQIIKAGNALPY